MIVQLLFALGLTLLSSGFTVSTATAQLASADSMAEPTSDPLEGVNQPVFQFNLKVDEYVLHPIATGYNAIMPDAAQRGVNRFFRNLAVVERFANNLFQGEFVDAGQEVGRFLVNTTLGGVGFVDVADPLLGWKENHEDFGQTLGVYGVGTGPYLVIPFYGPSTVRDTVGMVADGAMNPMSYFLSTIQILAVRAGTTTTRVINYRSMNLTLFEDADRYAVDLYGATQDVYLQRRAKQIEE
ncbi:MAG: VacJ family lipoprotein [Deltaproteobacteria bacterium]|nr:VacJ family lipoprotein [Deltaproteobacteria bacterium]